MMKLPSLLVLLLLSPQAATSQDLHLPEAALTADDLCAEDGSSSCGISLHQLRGRHVSATPQSLEQSLSLQQAEGARGSQVPAGNVSGGTSGSEAGSGSESGEEGSSSSSSNSSDGSAEGNGTAAEQPGNGSGDGEEDPREWPLWTSSALWHNSSAPLFTFYMYRAVSDKVYPPLNVNTASLGGVLWYLHNEVVHHTPRKFSISKIIRLRVQTKATQPLYERGMNFGSRLAFDSGQATGPFVCDRQAGTFELCGSAFNSTFNTGAHHRSQGRTFEWDSFGYYVGCNNLGSFPFPMTPVQYPDAVWYSLPGPCPSRTFADRSAQCDAWQPGGLCEGPPGGSGNCTWSYEPAGEVSVDELVGITDYEAFQASGRREYIKDSDRGYGFTWWDSVKDRLANVWRMRKLDNLFAAKFPDLPRDSDMPPPPCDFKFGRFYQDPAFYSVPCHTAVRGETCFNDVTFAKRSGIHHHPEWYPGLDASSSFRDFQAFLYRTGPVNGTCPMPCDDAEASCHTAVQGEDCWEHVRFAMRDGIYAHPEWYPGLHPGDSFEEFQRHLHETGAALACPNPC